jgi:hypothetical protein
MSALPPQDPNGDPLYHAVYWNWGPGLLVCVECGALVWPDPDATVDVHQDWHQRIFAAVVPRTVAAIPSEGTDD